MFTELLRFTSEDCSTLKLQCFCEEEADRSVGDNLLNFFSCQCKLVSDLRINCKLPGCGSWVVQYLIKINWALFFFFFYISFVRSNIDKSEWTDRGTKKHCAINDTNPEIYYLNVHSKVLASSNYHVHVD